MKIDRKGRFAKVPLGERFWDKVDKNGPMHPTEPTLGRCWIWTGARITDRKATHHYGLIWNDAHTKRLRAHRVAWQLLKGRIPKGKYLLHSCDRPECINPVHTYPGTQKQNVTDMVNRGRALFGERNPAAVLKEAQVLEIRRDFPLRHKTGQRSSADRKIIAEICRKHGISPHQAWRIASGNRWNHITNRLPL